MVGAFKDFPENARFYGSTIMWLGFTRTLVYADHGVRFSGKPSYTFRKRLKLAIDILLSFSERPLKFAIGLGAFFSTFSTLLIIWIFYRKIVWGFSVVGWTSIVVLISFFSGIILTILGIIGIYIGRIFSESKRRPLYIIDKLID